MVSNNAQTVTFTAWLIVLNTQCERRRFPWPLHHVHQSGLLDYDLLPDGSGNPDPSDNIMFSSLQLSSNGSESACSCLTQLYSVVIWVTITFVSSPRGWTFLFWPVLRCLDPHNYHDAVHILPHHFSLSHCHFTPCQYLKLLTNGSAVKKNHH